MCGLTKDSCNLGRYYCGKMGTKLERQSKSGKKPKNRDFVTPKVSNQLDHHS